MTKRVLSAVLWAYVTWYACNILGAFIMVALPGALVGLAVGALVFARPILRGQAVATTASAPAVIRAES